MTVVPRICKILEAVAFDPDSVPHLKHDQHCRAKGIYWVGPHVFGALSDLRSLYRAFLMCSSDDS